MDYLSHGFWSYIFFHRIKKPFYAVFFGLMPDNLSWVIFFFYNLIAGTTFSGPPHLNEIPDWVFTLYGISHSLIVFVVVASIIYIVFRKIPLYIYAWPIAIVIDIFTHTRDFLPTPFLWPLSEWKFPGINWGDSLFMIINYSLIFLFLGYIIIKKRAAKV